MAYDGLLLDIDPPDTDGMTVLSEVRAGATGNLLVTARDALEDRVRRLNAGGTELTLVSSWEETSGGSPANLALTSSGGPCHGRSPRGAQGRRRPPGGRLEWGAFAGLSLTLLDAASVLLLLTFGGLTWGVLASDPIVAVDTRLATLLHGSVRLTWGTGWRRVQLAGPRTGPGECAPRVSCG
jgi:hypothetical protein